MELSSLEDQCPHNKKHWDHLWPCVSLVCQDVPNVCSFWMFATGAAPSQTAKSDDASPRSAMSEPSRVPGDATLEDEESVDTGTEARRQTGRRSGRTPTTFRWSPRVFFVHIASAGRMEKVERRWRRDSQCLLDLDP